IQRMLQALRDMDCCNGHNSPPRSDWEEFAQLCAPLRDLAHILSSLCPDPRAYVEHTALTLGQTFEVSHAGLLRVSPPTDRGSSDRRRNFGGLLICCHLQRQRGCESASSAAGFR